MKLLREFYDFMKERERIRLRRANDPDGSVFGPRGPWTEDAILQAYKFTNVKREHDRTTVGLNKIYTDCGDRDKPGEILLNCAVYRYFGTVEMAEYLGWTNLFSSENGLYAFKQYLIKSSVDRFQRGDRVFTGAYIIPNCGDSRPKHEVVADTLGEIWNLISHVIEEGYKARNSWQIMCDVITQAKGCGSFMAKEVLLDFILAMDWVPGDWETWTPVGPGGRRGATRVVTGASPQSPLNETRALQTIQDIYAQRAHMWPGSLTVAPGAEYPTPTLSLTDIQFQLCEFDKYMRTLNQEGRPKSKFTPTTN